MTCQTNSHIIKTIKEASDDDDSMRGHRLNEMIQEAYVKTNELRVCLPPLRAFQRDLHPMCLLPAHVGSY